MQDWSCVRAVGAVYLPFGTGLKPKEHTGNNEQRKGPDMFEFLLHATWFCLGCAFGIATTKFGSSGGEQPKNGGDPRQLVATLGFYRDAVNAYRDACRHAGKHVQMLAKVSMLEALITHERARLDCHLSNCVTPIRATVLETHEALVKIYEDSTDRFISEHDSNPRNK